MKNPCQENWEGMTPSESGRHCDKCKTEVIDFTQLTNSEIIHYFKSSKQREGCGRFLKSQIDTIQIPVDEEIFSCNTIALSDKVTFKTFGDGAQFLGIKKDIYIT